jgi:hypothetical protein
VSRSNLRLAVETIVASWGSLRRENHLVMSNEISEDPGKKLVGDGDRARLLRG